MSKIKVLFEEDRWPDTSWLEESQYDPSSPDYDPIYPSQEDMAAKRNAYDGEWYRNPDNHIWLDLSVLVFEDGADDWTLKDTLGNIDFLRDGNDYVLGTFYRVSDIPARCEYQRQLAREGGLPD